MLWILFLMLLCPLISFGTEWLIARRSPRSTDLVAQRARLMQRARR